jgi:hypothetical protein
VEFRLIYRGYLPAETGRDTRKDAKHAIRRALHPQLAELWTKALFKSGGMSFTSNPNVPQASLDPNEIAECHKVPNRRNDIYRFVPLIGDRFAISCSLDILFMRRDDPGSLLRHGGDIDNRIKVLFDGLRMPESNELPDDPPSAGEDPFFCLMQDDKFITEVRITTERLLIPIDPQSSESTHHVMLVIGVKTVVLNPLYAPWKFWNA